MQLTDIIHMLNTGTFKIMYTTISFMYICIYLQQFLLKSGKVLCGLQPRDPENHTNDKINVNVSLVSAYK